MLAAIIFRVPDDEIVLAQHYREERRGRSVHS
jgi:hypothetical protein